jgi:hypothetical protein
MSKSPEYHPGNMYLGGHGDITSYDQSKWAGVIDASVRDIGSMIELEGIDLSPEIKTLKRWTDWMIAGGFRLSDKEICANVEKFANLQDAEYEKILTNISR